MSIFDSVTVGSPVMAEQYNWLCYEITRLLREFPSTASFTYLGETGVTTNQKVTNEYSYSSAVPVPAVFALCDAVLHVLLCPTFVSGALDSYLPNSTLSWSFRGRSIDGTVGTYETIAAPVDWRRLDSTEPLGGGIRDIAVPVTFLGAQSSRYTGAFIAPYLVGTWGYSGNIPNFVAFCSPEV